AVVVVVAPSLAAGAAATGEPNGGGHVRELVPAVVPEEREGAHTFAGPADIEIPVPVVVLEGDALLVVGELGVGQSGGRDVHEHEPGRGLARSGEFEEEQRQDGGEERRLRSLGRGSLGEVAQRHGGPRRNRTRAREGPAGSSGRSRGA